MGHRDETITKIYRVKDDVEIKITNVVGQEQPGSWSVSLDDEVLASGCDEQTITVGRGCDLVYRELRIYFVVQDHQPGHVRITATTIVSGGEEDLEITHDLKGEAGDSTTYTTLIQFV